MAHDPHDPIVTVAVSPNFAQDSTILAATDGLSFRLGVFALLKSTDGGSTFSPVPGLPTPQEMWAIAFSPGYAQDQTIYIASSGGLYMTTNQGSTWTWPSNLPLVNVALSPNFATDNTLFIVTNNMTVYESTNRGQTFTQIPLPASIDSPLTVLAASPNFDMDGTLLLGTVADGIYESTNAGTNWSWAGGNASAVTSLVFSPGFSSDQTMFAGTGAGVLISTNAGSSWVASNTGLTDVNVNSISLSPQYLQDGTLWVCSAVGGVFQSTNQGASWASTPLINRQLSPLTTSHYHNLAPVPGANGTILFLSTYEGLWSAPASSISWQYIDTLPTRLVRHVLLSPNYINDQTVFGATYGGGNLWSTNGGGSWSFQNAGMTLAYIGVSGISPNYALDGTVFSSVSGRLERSVNGGATWQRMNQLGASSNARGFAVSPNFAQDSTVMIGTNNDPGLYPAFVYYQGQPYPNQGLFLSYDGGDHWVPTSLGGPPINSVAISPAFATDQTAFVGSGTDGLFKSTDGGNTWTSVPLPHPSVAKIESVVISPAFATDKTVYVAAQTGGLLKSTNRGAHWTTLSCAANLLIVDLHLSPNYASDQTFFAGTLQGGLMKSTDGGNTLVSVSSFPDVFPAAIGISPNFVNDQTLLVAGYHSVFKSTDGGNTWTDTVAPGRIEESRTVSVANPVDQPPPTIAYQGAWSSTHAPSASTSAFMATTTAQNTAVLNFVGTGIAWVSPTEKNGGTATVTLDGVSQGTVSLSSPTTQSQVTVWQTQGLPCVPHTIIITDTSAKPGQSVTLDAFDVWINACPEANQKMK